MHRIVELPAAAGAAEDLLLPPFPSRLGVQWVGGTAPVGRVVLLHVLHQLLHAVKARATLGADFGHVGGHPWVGIGGLHAATGGEGGIVRVGVSILSLIVFIKWLVHY